jgi:hypothetical protein
MKKLKIKAIPVITASIAIFFAIFFLMVHIINKPSISEAVDTKKVSSPPSVNQNIEATKQKAEPIEIKEKKYSFRERLSKDGPELRFDMYGKFKNDYLIQGHIKIFDISKSKRIQRIIINNNFPSGHFDWYIGGFEYNGHEVQLVDLNFDGYLDLRILDNEGATGNNWYTSFLYDPEKGKFIHNWHLSSQSGLTVDPENKQVFTYDRCGWCYEFMKYYKYQNGHYTLSKIEWTDMDRTKEPGCFKITGVPKVRDIKIDVDTSCNPDLSDSIKKRVKIVKIEGLTGWLDGKHRGVLGNVIR